MLLFSHSTYFYRSILCYVWYIVNFIFCYYLLNYIDDILIKFKFIQHIPSNTQIISLNFLQLHARVPVNRLLSRCFRLVQIFLFGLLRSNHRWEFTYNLAYTHVRNTSNYIVLSHSLFWNTFVEKKSFLTLWCVLFIKKSIFQIKITFFLILISTVLLTLTWTRIVLNKK